MFKNNKYNLTAFLLCMTYFCHGMQAILITQNPTFFAEKWGMDSERIFTVVAWIGIGKIAFLIFSGPLSDKIGRKPLIMAGLAGYVIMFASFLFATDLWLVKFLAFIGGAMTSFFDGAINPALFEVYPKNKSTASVLGKSFISISSILYPLVVAYLAAQHLDPQIGIYIPFVFSLLVLIGITFSKFPDLDVQKEQGISASQAIKVLEKEQSSEATKSGGMKKKNLAKFAVDGVILSLFALTIYSNFYLFQQSSKIYATDILGMSETSAATVTSLYQLGGLVATLAYSVLMAKGIRDIAILNISPFFAGLAGLVVFFYPTPLILTIAGIVVGFFAAGGLLQMGNGILNQFFDTNKGRNTSIYYFVMALGSYLVPTATSSLIQSKNAEAIMMIVAVTGILSGLLMLFVGKRYRYIFGVSIFSNSKYKD